MGFQIKNSEGNTFTINNLDKEVCNLWGHPVDKKAYCVPLGRDEFDSSTKGYIEYLRQSNWYDSVGYMIHSEKCSSWDQVINSFKVLYKDILEEYKMSLEVLIPHEMKLINHWNDKGYTPNYHS